MATPTNASSAATVLDVSFLGFEEAARALGGVAERDVRFLLACGVLEGQGRVHLDSLRRFAAEAQRGLGRREALGDGVRRAVLELRTAWDRALVERGPSPEPVSGETARVLGAVELGRHPDGVVVFAVLEPLAGLQEADLRHATGAEVRQLVVERALFETWGVAAPERRRLGELLVQHGRLSGSELEDALEAQRRGGGKPRLGEILVGRGLVSWEDVDAALLAQAGLPFASLAELALPEEAVTLVPAAFARSRRVVPLAAAGRGILVATSRPSAELNRALRDVTGLEVATIEVTDTGIARGLERLYGKSGTKAPGYVDFETTKEALGVAEEELKRLVSQGELRGFRDGLSLKFKSEDVENLRAGRETEPTIILTDSDQEIGIAESSELILEDSPRDEVIEIRDILGGDAPAKDLGRADPFGFVAGKLEAARKGGEVTTDKLEVVDDTAPDATLEPVPCVELPSIAEEMDRLDNSDAGLVACGEDESLETEAFELIDERAETEPATGAFRRLAPPPKTPPAFAPPPPPPPGYGGFADFAGSVAAAPAPAPSIPRPAPVARSGLAAPMNFAPPQYAERSSGSVLAKAAVLPFALPIGAAGAVVAGARALASAMTEGTGAKERQEQAKQDDEPETFERKATVRYFSQMYARQNYPLIVIVSKRSIQKIVQKHVAQVEGKKAFTIRRGNPFVQIRPILPGCLCVPAETTLNVKPKVAEAKFWVTPQAEGFLDGAKVEVLYEGKVVSTIDVPTRVTTQTMAKVMGSGAFLVSTAGPFFEAFGLSVKKASASFLADLLAHTAAGTLRYGVVGVFAFLALVFYLMRRPKQGPDLDGFFDWGVEDAVEGDPLVRAVKARLVVAGPEGTETHDVVHASTLVGSAATAHVRVRGVRNLADVAFELRYDDAQGFLVRSRAAGVTVNGEGLVEGEERRLGRDGLVEVEGGRAALWLMDLRRDDALDARRDEVLEALVRARPPFEDELRAVFKRRAEEPVRASVLEAVEHGFADAYGWRRVRESMGIR